MSTNGTPKLTTFADTAAARVVYPFSKQPDGNRNRGTPFRQTKYADVLYPFAPKPGRSGRGRAKAPTSTPATTPQAPRGSSGGLCGGCALFSAHTKRLEDDEVLPNHVWFLSGGRAGEAGDVTGKRLRTWKQASKYDERKTRSFWSEVVYVLTQGKGCRGRNVRAQ